MWSYAWLRLRLPTRSVYFRTSTAPRMGLATRLDQPVLVHSPAWPDPIDAQDVGEGRFPYSAQNLFRAAICSRISCGSGTDFAAAGD